MFRTRTSVGLAATAVAFIASLVATQPAAAADGTGLIEDEPVSVTVIGDIGVDFGEQIALDELVAAAADRGQDVSLQLDDSASASADSETQKQAVAAAADPWGIVNQWDDNEGVDVYLRYGNGTSWGWIKARDKHGVTQTMIQKTTQFPRERTQQGTAFVYVTPAIEYSCTIFGCTPVRSMDMKVVNETTSAQGVITAYCPGVVICPQWVRDAAAG